MTKKELFLSASIMVVFALCVDAAYNAAGANRRLSSVLFHLSVGNLAWCEFVPSLLMRLTGAAWLGHISLLMPYVFVLFGKKKSEEAAE